MKELLEKLENLCDEYLVKKAPFQIPEKGRTVLVDFMPWIALIFGIMGAVALLGLLGLTGMVMPFAYLSGVGAGIGYFISLIISIIAVVLELMSVQGLMKKQMKGWRFAYYSVLVTAVGNIVTFNLIGLVIGTLLSLYLLFQVKGYYKG